MQGKVKSKLGQNFLVDEQAQRRIVDALGAAATGAVVEIGPGRAAITSLLAERAERLVAIELDPALARVLRSQFAGQANVSVVEGDVLSVDLASLAPGPAPGLAPVTASGRTLAVVGNLPYYITSPILQHLFLHEHALSRAVLTVQREVAQRMTATEGHSEYGALSVLCQLHAELQLLFTLPPEAFQPAPEVHSAVVRLEFAPKWRELGVEPLPFTRFLRACFAQKRKTLANNLRAAGYPGARVQSALETGNHGGVARAEELSPAALAAIFRGLGPAEAQAG